MNKQLDIAIVDAIKSIIESTDYDVTYDIHKGTDDVLFKKKQTEVVSVNIKLVKPIRQL